MSQPHNPARAKSEETRVAMSEIAKFLRQLSHDLRNHLNAAELQSAYVGELAEDAELKGEVQRLRAMLGEMGRSLQGLTAALAPVKLTLMPYEALDFMEDLRQKIATQFPEESQGLEWAPASGVGQLTIDPQVLQPAFLELFANAFRHERGSGALRVKTERQAGQFIFTLKEPKNSFTGETENWGGQPFGKVKQGHYGLGLPRARSIIEAHQGQLSARYDSPSSTLITIVALPLVPGP